MKTSNLKIVYVSLDDLKPNEYNPKKISLKELNNLEKSIKEFGIVDPLIVNSAENRKNVIIGGHQRYKVYKKLKFKEVPVIYVNIPDIEKEKELCLRLTKNTGEWDFDLLADFDKNLLEQVGFNKDELKNIFDLDSIITLDDLEKEKEKIKISNVYELSDKVLNFESDNEYDIPNLREDRMIKKLPGKELIIDTFFRTGNIVLFSKRRYYKGDKLKALLCFYEFDEKFDVFWYETKKIAEEILKDKWFGVITPNWSLYRTAPVAFQIFNVFKSRYIGRYLQELGLNIIPDVNFSDEKSYKFCLLGIPKDLNYISIQAQTLYTEEVV